MDETVFLPSGDPVRIIRGSVGVDGVRFVAYLDVPYVRDGDETHHYLHWDDLYEYELMDARGLDKVSAYAEFRAIVLERFPEWLDALVAQEGWRRVG